MKKSEMNIKLFQKKNFTLPTQIFFLLRIQIAEQVEGKVWYCLLPILSTNCLSSQLFVASKAYGKLITKTCKSEKTLKFIC